MIEKIVTARGPEYFVGGLVSTSNTGEEYSKVTGIVFVGGDYELGAVSAYDVNLRDGRTIKVKDAVEVWYSPEPETVPDKLIDIGDGLKAHPAILAAILPDDDLPV
jgi:hypothetical protein